MKAELFELFALLGCSTTCSEKMAFPCRPINECVMVRVVNVKPKTYISNVIHFCGFLVAQQREITPSSFFPGVGIHTFVASAPIGPITMQTAAMFANLPIGSVVYGSMLAPPNMPPGMHLIGGELTATPLSPGCLMRYVKTSSGWSAGEMITQQMLQEELASQKNPNIGVANVEVERPSKEEKQTDAAGLQDAAQMLRLPTVANNRKKCGMKAKKGQTLMQSGMFYGIPAARKTQKIQDDISDAATTASVKSGEAVDFTFYSF